MVYDVSRLRTLQLGALVKRRTQIAVLVIGIILVILALAFIPACSVGFSPKAGATPIHAMRGGVIALPLSMPAASKQPVPYSIYKGPNTTKYVIPTYDDCPRSAKEFKTMIDYSSAHDKALVVFPTGDCIKSYKKRGFDLVGYARDRGIWTLNHSISHPPLTTLSLKAVVKQISGTAVANYGRPPYGAINATVRKAYKSVSSYGRHGMRIWNWTVDTEDWKAIRKGSSERPSSATIVKRALASVKAGGTILMHMQWHGFNPKTLRALETGLAKKGLKLCHAWHGEDGEGPIEPTGRIVPRNIC
ncbi:MAG: polysaccharide deacetylase family protein [Candidatus Saccharimonas sp.]